MEQNRMHLEVKLEIWGKPGAYQVGAVIGDLQIKLGPEHLTHRQADEYRRREFKRLSKRAEEL